MGGGLYAGVAIEDVLHKVSRVYALGSRDKSLTALLRIIGITAVALR